MKPTRLLAALLAIGVLSVGAAALTVRAMRTVPDWYAERAAALDETPAPEPKPGGLLGVLGGLLGIETRHASSLMEQLNELASTGRVELDEERLAAVLETSMSSTRDGRAVLDALETPLARIVGNTIEFGGVVQLDDLDTGSMSATAAANVEALRRWLPAIADRPVYVGLRTVPEAANGQLRMSRDAALVLGRIVVPGWLLPLDEVRSQLDLDLRAVNLTRAEVIDGHLVLEAGPGDQEN